MGNPARLSRQTSKDTVTDTDTRRAAIGPAASDVAVAVDEDR